MAHYFMVTGESSGDRLGAMLASELLAQGHDVCGWGGSEMSTSGVQIVQNISALKVMGWVDILKGIYKYYRLFNKCKSDIAQFKPDKIVLIDFGGFNLRLAQWAKKNNYKVIYYSPPKIWASRPRRIKYLKKSCDQIIVLFPFEQTYYQKKGLKVEFYGHPFATVIKNFQENKSFRTKYRLDSRPIISLLPGSRPSEIRHTLPVYIRAVASMKKYQICVSCAEGQYNLIQNICSASSVHCNIIQDDFYNLLSTTDLAVITSGTATFEAALFNIPQVVGYKTSWLNYLIAKNIITTEYISLINLIAGKEVVTELIQSQLEPTKIKDALIQLNNSECHSVVISEYQDISSLVYIKDGLEKTIESISN